MKNKAYTLSEILITLGIIGVVAALTIPSLVNNSVNRTIGASLSKAVHDLESATLNIIHMSSDSADEAQSNEDVANNLSAPLGAHTLDMIVFADLIPNGNNNNILSSGEMFTTLQGATSAVRLNNNEFAYINNATMYNSNNSISSNNKYSFIADRNVSAFKFSKGNSVIIYAPTSENTLSDYADNHDDRIEDDVVVGRVLIDSNGSDAPNKMGKDIFIFGITNGGRLVPAGSNAYNNNVFGNNLNENLYTVSCNGANIAGDGASCAARVVADGWKINYKQ